MRPCLYWHCRNYALNVTIWYYNNIFQIWFHTTKHYIFQDNLPIKYWTVIPTSFPSLEGTLNLRNLATAYSSFVGFSGPSWKKIHELLSLAEQVWTCLGVEGLPVQWGPMEGGGVVVHVQWDPMQHVQRSHGSHTPAAGRMTDWRTDTTENITFPQLC